MKNKLLVCLLFLLISQSFHAQTAVYTGTVQDKSSGEDLAYVNIGIVNKNVGTVSDTNGKFSLELDPKFDQETLKISMIGYKTRTFTVADFKNTIAKNALIKLEKNVSELKEVVVRSKKLKPGILGNILGKKTVSAGFVNNVLGNEIGVVIKLKKKPAYISAFHAMVDYNRYRELKFRLNFYDLKDGLPNNNINTENIIVTSEIKKGRLTVDLTDYNIWVEGDFFVSIELIEGLGEGGLHFLADYNGSPIITRAVSQGRWNPQEELSFGFSVSAKY